MIVMHWQASESQAPGRPGPGFKFKLITKFASVTVLLVHKVNLKVQPGSAALSDSMMMSRSPAAVTVPLHSEAG
jgi:hypothetical protein